MNIDRSIGCDDHDGCERGPCKRLLDGQWSCYACSMASSGICRQHADDVARVTAAIEHERGK